MTDHELTSRILNGDLGSFNTLVRQNERLVFHLVHKVLGSNREEVEDLCQEVFLKIYKNLKSFNNEAKLSTWIGSIAYRTAIAHCTKKGIETTELTFITPEKESTRSPEKELILQDEKQYLRAQIELLPAQHKTCLLLFHYEEMSIKEIEKITGLTENTIKSNLFRARKMLKEHLTHLNPQNIA